MRHRSYDPAYARFLTPDPLGAWGDPMSLGNEDWPNFFKIDAFLNDLVLLKTDRARS